MSSELIEGKNNEEGDSRAASSDDQLSSGSSLTDEDFKNISMEFSLNNRQADG